MLSLLQFPGCGRIRANFWKATRILNIQSFTNTRNVWDLTLESIGSMAPTTPVYSKLVVIVVGLGGVRRGRASFAKHCPRGGMKPRGFHTL